MYQKLKLSNKENKLQLGKYLLSRLLRESDRILAIAQKYSTDNYPNKDNCEENISFSHSVTLH